MDLLLAPSILFTLFSIAFSIWILSFSFVGGLDGLYLQREPAVNANTTKLWSFIFETSGWPIVHHINNMLAAALAASNILSYMSKGGGKLKGFTFYVSYYGIVVLYAVLAEMFEGVVVVVVEFLVTYTSLEINIFKDITLGTVTNVLLSDLFQTLSATTIILVVHKCGLYLPSVLLRSRSICHILTRTCVVFCWSALDFLVILRKKIDGYDLPLGYGAYIFSKLAQMTILYIDDRYVGRRVGAHRKVDSTYIYLFGYIIFEWVVGLPVMFGVPIGTLLLSNITAASVSLLWIIVATRCCRQ